MNPIFWFLLRASWLTVAIAAFTGFFSGACSVLLLANLNNAVSSNNQSRSQLVWGFIYLAFVTLVTGILSRYMLVYKPKFFMTNQVKSEQTMETYRIVAELNENQISELVDLYKNEFWSKERDRQDVVKMLAASQIIIGLVDDRDRLVGFTRVLTDFVYRAIIFDVIVKPTHRKKGLGAKLIDAIINHPELQSVESLGLYCLEEMMPFYERWGFTGDIGKIRLMRLTRSPS